MFVCVYIYILTVCTREANALVSVHISIGSAEPSLCDNAMPNAIYVQNTHMLNCVSA